MTEVRLARIAAEEMQRRLETVLAEIRRETQQGLDADWTAVAEGFDALRSLAEHGSSKAWVVAYEADESLLPS